MDEQHTQSFIYTKRPLFGPKCAKASDTTIREKRNGASAIPNGSRLSTHFPFCVTKAVCLAHWQLLVFDGKRFERRTQLYSVLLRLCQDGSLNLASATSF